MELMSPYIAWTVAGKQGLGKDILCVRAQFLNV